VAAPALFTAVWATLGAAVPGYSPLRHWVSSLSLAPGAGRVQVAAFLLTGVLLLLFAVGLGRSTPTGPGSTWGPRWIAVVGAGLVAAGLFPIGPALGYPPGGSEAGSTAPLHDLAGLAVFVGLTAAPAVWGRRWQRAWSLGSATAVIGFWVAGGVLAGLDYAGVWTPAPAGLAERVSITAGMLWLLTVAMAEGPSPERTAQPAGP
jgi:hypothetical protein